MNQLLHPELNLPYGTWIQIGVQERAGAIWRYHFTGEEIDLMERIHNSGKAWIFIVRSKTDRLAFVRMLWLKAPVIN